MSDEVIPEGINLRHRSTCASRDGQACKCTPAYQAEVYDKRHGKRKRKTFPTLAAAVGWRRDAQAAIRSGERRAPTGVTVAAACEAWLEGVKAGRIRNRSGDPYKPSVVRSYEAAITRHITPALGRRKLEDVTTTDVQDMVDDLRATHLSPSSVRNAVLPLRVVYRRAVRRGEVPTNPVSGVELDAVRSQRDRIATPAEAASLLASVPEADRAVWATAMYAGLRRGELQALRWGAVNLAAGIVEVRESYDSRSGTFVLPKSRSGVRRVPLAGVLRDYLDARIPEDGDPTALVFARPDGRPFCDSTLRKRAREAWSRDGLTPITLHECRHTYASVMIAAGVNAKALSTYMGHAAISITFDRYGHLMPGSEAEAAGLLDAFLTQATVAPTVAGVSQP